MITRQGNRLLLEGSVTIANVRQVLEAGIAEIETGALEIDLGALDAVDSAAISMIFEWLRRAGSKNRTLRFLNLTDDLKSLAKLYGVTELIPQD